MRSNQDQNLGKYFLTKLQKKISLKKERLIKSQEDSTNHLQNAKYIGLEKKVPSENNNQNIKCADRRKKIKNCKGKGQETRKALQTYCNYKDLDRQLQTPREHRCQMQNIQLHCLRVSISVKKYQDHSSSIKNNINWNWLPVQSPLYSWKKAWQHAD